MLNEIKYREILACCTFSAVRSSGPGGQHVNKTSTAIILKFDINCGALDEETINRLIKLAATKINKYGELTIRSENSRSQYQNKEDAINKLTALIEKAMTVRKKRKRTKPSRNSVHKRIESKKQRGEIKQSRKKFKI